MTSWLCVVSVWLLICPSGVGHLLADEETTKPKNTDKAQNEKVTVLIAADDDLNAGDLK